jgi:hypothetical protein
VPTAQAPGTYLAHPPSAAVRAPSWYPPGPPTSAHSRGGCSDALSFQILGATPVSRQLPPSPFPILSGDFTAVGASSTLPSTANQLVHPKCDALPQVIHRRGVALFVIASLDAEVLLATSPTQEAVSLRLPNSGYILRGARLT